MIRVKTHLSRLGIPISISQAISTHLYLFQVHFQLYLILSFMNFVADENFLQTRH